MRGGIHANSPNGLYILSATDPLSPTFGGTYNIELIDAKTSIVVRRAVVSVPRSERTVVLREGEGAIVWDPASAFVDIRFSGNDSIRIWVPK